MSRTASLLVCMSMVVLSAGCGTPAHRFDPQRPLFLASGGRHEMSQLNAALDDVFASRSPVVLYVHGRGREPEKSVEKGIVDKIERQYGVRVLMFNWDSKALLTVRPTRKATAAGPGLREVIVGLARYRRSHPGSRGVPVTLLAHSIGNLVLQAAVEGDAGLPLAGADGPLFATVVLTASDADAGPHAGWVSKLTAAHHVLLTVNRGDGVLRFSDHRGGERPVGTSDLEPPLPLAPRAVYLDLTGLVGAHHRLFAKGAMDGQEAVCRIMTAALRGEPCDLRVGGPLVAASRRPGVLVPRQIGVGPCFAGVASLPVAEEVQDAED